MSASSASRPVARLGAPLLVALVAVTATACSNSESPVQKNPRSGTGTATPVDGVQQITITTGNDYRFHPSTIVVHPGRVTITLKNTSRQGAPHNLSLGGFPAAFVPLATAGRSTSATFTAPAPGTYTFVCTIHVQQGQTGKLIVKPAGS